MKRVLNRILPLTLLLILLITSFPVSAGTEEAGYRQKVRVGWYISERFQEGEAGQDRKSGYSYEYLQYVANYTGWEYEYVPGGWSELYDALLNGEIDLLAGLSYTEERAALLDYPAYEMGLESYYIYKKAGNEEISGIDLSTLNGKRVGTLRNNLMTEFFEAWMENTGVTCTEVLYNDFETRDKAFAEGMIDALIAVNNNVASNSGFTPVVAVGESSYYLGVSKGREALLDSLNKALAALKESNPYFIQSLQLKYFNHTAVNAALSREESEWVTAHGSVKAGYLDDFMPYCDLAADGTVRGVISDVFREWLEQLDLTEKIRIEYKPYSGYDDMIAALRSGEIDAAFPVYDSIWNSEKLGIVQTNSLVESGVHMVYRGEYSDATAERIAVSDVSAFQQAFAAEKYPESEIYSVNTPEDCLEAVKQGKATCAFFDSGQAETLLSKRKFRNLNRLTMGESISYCIGVKKGNNVMYSLLSRGMSLIDKSNTTNAIYAYIGSDIEYSLIDFLLDHIGLAVTVLLIIAGLIVAVNLIYRQANIDSLTGLGNKRAYQRAVRQLEDRIRDNRAEFTVAVFDLNGLKAINDKYGHESGDMALSDAGRILKKVFGDVRVYRFGGDEFIAVDTNSTLESMKQRFGLLDWELEELERIEKKYAFPLALAKGAAAYIPETDADFMTVFERADQAMYEDKRKYYEEHKDRQRKKPDDQ